MKDDFHNYLPTVMFRGRPCMLTVQAMFEILKWYFEKLHFISTEIYVDPIVVVKSTTTTM